MPTAYQIIPSRFEDGRHEAFEAGARAAGYKVVDARHMTQPRGAPGDILMTWNLHGTRDIQADAFRSAGGQVVVAEEGYTRYLHPVKHFAVALNGHNGSGQWNPQGPERWAALGLGVAPWREGDGYVLVCGQRGIGSRTMASPQKWHEQVAHRLKFLTVDPIVVRPHPGKDKATAPDLDTQIDGARAVVVWSSAVALRALLRGVPVFFDAPHHVLAPAMMRLRNTMTPLRLERLPALQDMAWAQWTMDEIASGAPFRHLLP